VKFEGGIFAVGAVIFVALAAIYWFMAFEPVGTTALLLTGGLCFLIAFYVLFTGRRIGVRPEDDLDAEVAEGAGEYGRFAPTSWWPLAVGVGAASTALGLVVGWWLFVLGFVLLVMAIVGLVFENYFGESYEA
jgi:hypothetical protein